MDLLTLAFAKKFAESAAEEKSVKIDSTLTKSGEAADAKVTGDEIASIRAAVGRPSVASTVSEMTDHDLIYVYVGSEAGYTSGNWYYWDGTAWTSGGVYNSTAFQTDPTLSISGAAADAKVVGDDFERLYTAVAEKPDDISKTKVALEYTTGAVLANGTINTSYTTYSYSQKLAVSKGDIITPVGDSGAYFRWLCAYSGSTAVASAGATSGIERYVVPEGIDGVIVTTPNSYHVTDVFIRHFTEKGIYEPLAPSLGKFNWKGDLSDGDVIELLSSNVQNNVVWVFTGHVGTMGKISIGNNSIGHGFVELVSVDSTYLYYREPSASSPIISVAHGLTIANDLLIRVETDWRVNYVKKIIIHSSGSTFTLDDDAAYKVYMYGYPCVKSIGAVMSDCAFSWIPQDIDKPIWIFGDSWESMFENRWVYYLVQSGFTNTWMINAYAGENSNASLDALYNLLSIRRPEYIVWMIGMNDADTSNAVNAVWKKVYDTVRALCSRYKINLILYTVPNTPTINNSFKNAIVQASGYRYIDGVAAVGDDGSGNWFEGYEQSSTDHNHTSAKGAIALFMRVLADFPEIAGNSI